MPIIQSAKKALRQNTRRRKQNLKRKNEMKLLTKALKKVLGEQKQEEVRRLLPLVYRALDKAAKKNVIKKNTASRKKSRLARLAAKAFSPPPHAS